ncbi:hypothetical protein SL103_31330 [Streptomyces lydicus]|uniref:Uncharacterized protein n=1 Tax=Streptomyces lydicus TaxID=47763 RepID=A0A1D7VTQ9_9ACTN|nr:hypothetical protein SL103_31330 [Streptomyces lydicus]
MEQVLSRDREAGRQGFAEPLRPHPSVSRNHWSQARRSASGRLATIVVRCTTDPLQASSSST